MPRSNHLGHFPFQPLAQEVTQSGLLHLNFTIPVFLLQGWKNSGATHFQNWAFTNHYFGLKLLSVGTVRCITIMHKEDHHRSARIIKTNIILVLERCLKKTPTNTGIASWIWENFVNVSSKRRCIFTKGMWEQQGQWWSKLTACHSIRATQPICRKVLQTGEQSSQTPKY